MRMHWQADADLHKAHPEVQCIQRPAFVDEAVIAQEWERQLAAVRTPEDLAGALLARDGSFAVIAHTRSRVVAAVDKVRSLPLFYSQPSPQELVVSDDLEWVGKVVGGLVPCQQQLLELQFAGYTTGATTPYTNVRQLRAGEAIFADIVGERLVVKPVRYYEFSHRLVEDRGETYWKDQLLARLDTDFQRFADAVRGRAVVVPLSAGMDSRLIALMLKRHGVRDVLCYSYGRPGNEEATVSKEIAGALGFDWYFTPYSNTEWARWARSEAFRSFGEMSGNRVAVPNVQDWPAVQSMHASGVLPEGAVIVPGHSADLLAGSRSEAMPWLYGVGTSEERVARYLLDRHFALWGGDRPSDIAAALDEAVARSLDFQPELGREAAPDAYERWEWQERQAKFIVNSVRVYDQVNCDWWLPFWSDGFMDFWAAVPVSYRRRRTLYRRFVEELGEGTAGLRIGSRGTLATAAVSYLRGSPFRAWIRSYRQARRREDDYEGHSLAWFGMVNRERFAALYTGRETVNSFLALDIVRPLGEQAAQAGTGGETSHGEVHTQWADVGAARPTALPDVGSWREEKHA